MTQPTPNSKRIRSQRCVDKLVADAIWSKLHNESTMLILPAQVWLTANPSINTANFPEEVDGIQNTLSLIINDNTHDSLLCKTLYTLWYIWKARNDYHFNRKEWTPQQVHQAAQTYMAHYEHNHPQSSVGFAHPSGLQPSILQDTNANQGVNPYYCPNPACLQDSRCYVDVAVVSTT